MIYKILMAVCGVVAFLSAYALIDGLLMHF